MIINFKTFSFPSFKKWSENDYKFEEVLGAYRCVIVGSSFGFKFAVALADQYPANIWADTIFYEPFAQDPDNTSELEEWYHKTVKKFVDFWQKYMNSTYISNDNKEV